MIVYISIQKVNYVVKSNKIIPQEMIGVPFPEILKELREKKGFTQEQLASALHLSKNAISHYEQGRNDPSIQTLQHIADIFDVSVDYLIGRTSIPVQFSALKKNLTPKTSIDDFVNMLLSLDSPHRNDLIRQMEYIKFHNDVSLKKK